MERHCSIKLSINLWLVVFCISTSTTSDISFAVTNIAKYFSKPTQRHWNGVKKILRYLKGTATHCLMYATGSTENFHGFSNSDFAGDLDDRKSIGCLFLLGGAPSVGGVKSKTLWPCPPLRLSM